jgi:hypothetical protein
VHEITALPQELSNAERPIHDDFLVSVFVSGLPPKFEAFVAGVINNLRLQDSRHGGKQNESKSKP